jgi:glycoside/pentoside/hexuronide:cation symporter, GPH family
VDNVELQEEFVPLKSRVWVAGADAACAMLGQIVVTGTLTYFFTRWRGLDARLAGIVWLIFGIWNAVNDPLFGWISDRTRSGLGRRIPYIRYGAPLYALSFILCWINWPGSGDQTLLFVQFLLLLFLFDTLYTAIATSIYVMPYEMAVSNKARSTIFLWKIVLSVFPLAVPLAVIPFIQPGPGEDATMFQGVMVGLGLAMGAVILVSTFFYREKHFQQAQQQFAFGKSLVECFRNLSFVLFEVISFTIIYVQTALMQGVLYYFDEFDVPPIPLYAALAVGIVAGLVLFLRKRETWGVKTSVRLMALIFCLGCFTVLLLGRSLLPTMIGFFTFGIGFAGGMYLIPLMNGDVVDMDEERTGLRREGMYAGVNSFITKPAISVAQAIFLWMLGAFGYDQGLGKGLQSASAETGILMGWTLVPGALLLLCFVVLHWYPLAGPAWEEIKRKLAALHAEKERQYLEAQGYRYME